MRVGWRAWPRALLRDWIVQLPRVIMRRREFISLLGGTALSARAAHGQNPTVAVPVVGFLAASSSNAPSGPVEAIHVGLRQAGFEIGQRVQIEYRYAND